MSEVEHAGRHAGDGGDGTIGAFFDVEPSICVEGRERVEWHREQGHVLVLLTSGTFISVEPLQKILDIPHLVCTRLVVEDGILTGDYHAPSCFGPGKLKAGMAFAEDHGIDLERSHFYTDSYSDLPMLERVGHPHVVNPDPRLRGWAQLHGMHVEHWHPQGALEPAAASHAQGRA